MSRRWGLCRITARLFSVALALSLSCLYPLVAAAQTGDPVQAWSYIAVFDGNNISECQVPRAAGAQWAKGTYRLLLRLRQGAQVQVFAGGLVINDDGTVGQWVEWKGNEPLLSGPENKVPAGIDKLKPWLKEGASWQELFSLLCGSEVDMKDEKGIGSRLWRLDRQFATGAMERADLEQLADGFGGPSQLGDAIDPGKAIMDWINKEESGLIEKLGLKDINVSKTESLHKLTFKMANDAGRIKLPAPPNGGTVRTTTAPATAGPAGPVGPVGPVGPAGPAGSGGWVSALTIINFLMSSGCLALILVMRRYEATKNEDSDNNIKMQLQIYDNKINEHLSKYSKYHTELINVLGRELRGIQDKPIEKTNEISLLREEVAINLNAAIMRLQAQINALKPEKGGQPASAPPDPTGDVAITTDDRRNFNEGWGDGPSRHPAGDVKPISPASSNASVDVSTFKPQLHRLVDELGLTTDAAIALKNVQGIPALIYWFQNHLIPAGRSSEYYRSIDDKFAESRLPFTLVMAEPGDAMDDSLHELVELRAQTGRSNRIIEMMQPGVGTKQGVIMAKARVVVSH